MLQDVGLGLILMQVVRTFMVNNKVDLESALMLMGIGFVMFLVGSITKPLWAIHEELKKNNEKTQK